MKATVPLADLRRVVGVAARAASGVAQNVYAGVHLALDDEGTVTATGSDVEMRASASCAATDGDQGAAVIPAKRLSAVLDGLRSDEVTITTEGVEATLTAGRSRVTLRVLDLQQWPRFAPVEGQACQLDSATWAGLGRVSVAASTDQARPSLAGVQCRNGLAGASDTYRLFTLPIPEAIDAHLPVRGLREALRLGTEGVMVTGSNEACFEMASGTVWTRLLADDPPDLNRALAMIADPPAVVAFDADEMLAVLRLVGVVSIEEPAVLTISAEGIDVSRTGVDIGDAADHVDVRGSRGIEEPQTYGFNPAFLTDAIEAVAPDGGRVELGLLGPRRLCRVHGPSVVDAAVMPVFLS